MSELLQSEGLIRRLKKGAPILLHKETVRLPRFTEIKEVDQKDVGGKGKASAVHPRDWPRLCGHADRGNAGTRSDDSR